MTEKQRLTCPVLVDAYRRRKTTALVLARGDSEFRLLVDRTLYLTHGLAE